MYICCYSKLVPQMLFKITSRNVTQNWFHKCYSKLFPQVLLEIGSASVAKNHSTNVTQNCFYKRYSKMVPQTLLKIDSQGVTQNYSTSGTKLKNVLICNFFLSIKSLKNYTIKTLNKKRPC